MSVLPVSKRKENVELYSCNGFTCDKGRANTEIWTWVIVSVRRPRRSKLEIERGMTLPVTCTAVVKNDITFKKGEWNHSLINQFADIYKREWRVDGEMPTDLSTTVRQAVISEIDFYKGWIADMVVDGETQEEIMQQQAILSALKKRLDKMKLSK